MYKPLAELIRPKSFDDICGQQHLVGQNGLLRRLTENGNIPNMIFYGPSGTGKTTTAGIIAEKTSRSLRFLNATTASLSDLRDIIGQVDTLMAPNGILLYLDEIQYFNKKQQQSLLEYTESGRITLIAATTENPYFYVYGALLSRATIFEFKPVPPEQVLRAVNRAAELWSSQNGERLELGGQIGSYIAQTCGGDVRKAVNAVELLANSCRPDGDGALRPSYEDAVQAAQRSAVRYDRDGDGHFDLLSAFHKSIRGSDPSAAVYYLARALAAGDLPSVCRRLLAAASEDIGLAYPSAAASVKACVDSALQLGMPEARLPLAQAAIMLATAPKSNSVVRAIDAAMNDIQNGKTYDIPANLRDAHYSGAGKLGRGLDYKYPHNYPNAWVEQQYLPDQLRGVEYYTFGDSKAEQRAREYWDAVKKGGKSEK